MSTLETALTDEQLVSVLEIVLERKLQRIEHKLLEVERKVTILGGLLTHSKEMKAQHHDLEASFDKLCLQLTAALHNLEAVIGQDLIPQLEDVQPSVEAHP